jgi:cyclic patellamide precursor peptide PatG
MRADGAGAGLQVPIVAFDQLYSFDRKSLVQSIPRPEKTSAKEFGPVAEEVLDRILEATGNAGASDEHRALNYLAVRDPAIYARAAEAFARNNSLTCVEVRPSALSGARRIVDVIFGFTNRSTDVMEKFFVRVDVTEEFPFLVSKLSPYFDR